MNSPAGFRLVGAVVTLLLAATLHAQTATLTGNTAALSRSGGTVILTATATYDGTPGALGWSIAVPADWTLVAVTGPNLPGIAPQSGSTGTLEFAFTGVPPQRAEFAVEVRYPAGAGPTPVAATVLVRASGQLVTLKPTPVEFRPAD
jgi:hypothetical protein